MLKDDWGRRLAIVAETHGGIQVKKKKNRFSVMNDAQKGGEKQAFDRSFWKRYHTV